MKILNDWIGFFNFLKKSDYSMSDGGCIPKLYLTINSFILLALLFIPTLIVYTIYTALLDETPKSLHKNLFHVYPPLLLYLIVALYEEYSFRGFLTKFNPFLFAISISGIIAMYYKKITFRNMTFELEGLTEMGIVFVILSPIIFLLAKLNRQLLNRFWSNNFKYIMYSSAILFACAHFFNSVDLSITYLPSTFFQLLMALVFSYVRINAGLFFAISIHFFWNLIIYGF